MSKSDPPARRGSLPRSGFTGLILLAAVAGSLALAQSPAQATHALSAAAVAQAGQWQVSTAATNSPDNSFNATAALSATDVWAVGSNHGSTPGVTTSTLIEHFDGSRWSIVPSPNRHGVIFAGDTDSNALNGVYAFSPSSVWAVGYSGSSEFSGSASLVEHWNGSAWSLVPSPNGITPLSSWFNTLNAVSGTSDSDVWAVGSNGTLLEPGILRPTIQHWNGTTWSLTPAPPIGNNAQNVVLQAVTALAPDNAWATGFYGDDGTATITHPLALHWDGVQWTMVDVPDVTVKRTFNKTNLKAVKAISANDVWAAGDVSYLDDNNTGQVQALIEHWNGTQWAIVRSPSQVGVAATLTGLATFAADDIWAVGTTGSNVDGGARTPLLEHWNGSDWAIVDSPAVDKNYNCGFFGATATASGAQAVGACIAIDSTTQPHATPLAELFRDGGTLLPPNQGTPPAAPTNLVATTDTPTDNKLTWKDNSNNEGEFRIERCKGNNCTNFTQVIVAGSDVTTRFDPGLTQNTVYRYRIRATNSAGASAYSNIVTIKTLRF